MQKKGYIKHDSDGNKVGEMLFTYNEEEKQQNEVNAAHAKLIWQPRFIPFYPELRNGGLGIVECLIYGFIDFFLQKNDRFFFTNEQLGALFGVSERTITSGLTELSKRGLIKCSYKIRPGGGKVRIVKICGSDSQKTTCLTSNICAVRDSQNLLGIENKNYLIDNKPTSKKVLSRWLSKMEDVSNPDGLAEKYFKLYSAKAIRKALKNPLCTTRSKFTQLCKHYESK